MSRLYKVILCGDRDWDDPVPIRREIRKLRMKHGVTNLLIIEGGALGADTLSKIEGKKQNIHVAEIDALWDTRKRSAGPQRNKMMRRLDPDEVIGFHENIKKSKGTKEMLESSKKAGIKTKLVTK